MFGKILKPKPLTALCLASLLALSWGFPQRGLAEKDGSSREGLPGRRVGGGTRGSCPATEKQLTALIPQNNLGLTAAAYPTFFFYVPKTPAPKTVEFVLRDEKDSQVYEKTLTVSGASGILSLSLPAGELPPLEIGKNYQWYFSILCDPKNRAEDVSVDGWIQRVEPNPVLAAKLEKAPPDERAALYASADLWHDALVTLAQLRRERPDDSAIAELWTKLLQSVGLDTIVREPLLEYSSSNQPAARIHSDAK